MKKRMFLTLVLMGMIGFTFIGSEVKAQQIILRAVTAFPKPHLNNDPVPLFVDAVNKRAAGRLKIEWVGGPEVSASFDQIHAIKAGTIDMNLYYPFSYMKSLMPEADIKGLSELSGWEERRSGAFELWSEIFEKRVNAKYIGTPHSGPLFAFQFHCNRKIEKLADFKGLKIRVMPLYIPFLKAIGASPLTMPPTDIYTAMERGVVDGFMWARFGVASWGLQEVTKFTIDPGVFQIEPATMINLDRWKKIPKDLQELLMEVMQEYEYIGSMRGLMIVAMEDKLREKAGMQVIKLPAKDAEQFVKIAYDSTWEELTKIAPEYAPKLRRASSRAALPKGAFPWQ
jgi:TRAP-type C4-dicarboxylate transport system substrate-binding protein